MADSHPTSATRQQRPPRRRQREIIEAATRVFREKGYESTSIQDIAEAVGILKGSLYYYIDSKEDLLFEILRGAHEEALANLERSQGIEGDALVKIRAFVTIHLGFNVANLDKVAVFFHEFRALSEERRQVIVEERDIYDQFLRDLIREGQRESVICPEIDPKLTAIAILGMMNWLYHWYHPGTGASIKDVASAYSDFVVAGLACDPATHEPRHRGKVAALPQGFSLQEAKPRRDGGGGRA